MSEPAEPSVDVGLFPAPRACVVSGAMPAPFGLSEWLNQAPLAMQEPPALYRETQSAGWCGAADTDAERFTLSIRREGAAVVIESRATTRAGLRHARGALVQLARAQPGMLPLVEIEDAPVLARRGVMLDVSRCRIPTMDEFRRLIPELAALRCNHLQLYTEHTFAYTGHDAVWQGWSPITCTELVELDERCAQFGIELAANQNCFGHLRSWLEHPAYAPLAETHGDWMFDVWPRSGPFSLCPTDPASLRFVEGLLGELLPLVRSGLVNIGCDETYDIAYGRSAAEVRARGRGTVFAEFVAKVAAIAAGHGKRSMFWADIALSHPECLSMLPPDAIALAWGYEPDAPWGLWSERLAGREFWLSPGTSSWRSVTGRTTERVANQLGAVQAAVRHHAAGLLLCDWGDSGHWQTWPVALHALSQGLAMAWTGRALTERERIAASQQVLADPCRHLAAALDALGDVDAALRAECLPLSRPGVPGRLRNQSALFADLFKRWGEVRDTGSERAFADAVGRFEAIGPLPSSQDTLIQAELAHTARMTRGMLARFGERRGWPVGGLRDACGAEYWRSLRDESAGLWLKRSRSGGLAQSQAFFDRIEHADPATTPV